MTDTQVLETTKKCIQTLLTSAEVRLNPIFR